MARAIATAACPAAACTALSSRCRDARACLGREGFDRLDRGDVGAGEVRDAGESIGGGGHGARCGRVGAEDGSDFPAWQRGLEEGSG